MAIDDQQKRMSALGSGRPFLRAVFPVTTPTEDWRQNVGLTYSGGTLAAPVAPLPDGRMVGISRRFTRPAEILG